MTRSRLASVGSPLLAAIRFLAHPDDGADPRTLDDRRSDAATHHLGTAAIVAPPVPALRGAPAQAVHLGHVAAADIGQQGTDGDLGRRQADVDRPPLRHFGIGAAVDQRHYAPAAEALGQRRGHDVVLVVAGQGEKHFHLFDVLLGQQIFVGGVAAQYQRLPEADGNGFGALRIAFDQLDLNLRPERLRHPRADILRRQSLPA